MLDVGLAVTVAPVVLLNPVAGDQLYVDPVIFEEATMLTESPLQNVVAPPGVIEAT